LKERTGFSLLLVIIRFKHFSPALGYIEFGEQYQARAYVSFTATDICRSKIGLNHISYLFRGKCRHVIEAFKRSELKKAI
jgi:hypothetical protein